MAGPRQLLFELQLVLLITTLTFASAANRAGAEQLSGTVQYSGSLGTVSDAHPIRLFLFQSDPLQGAGGDANQVDNTVVTANGGSFTLNAPTAGSYYLAYELDVIPNDVDNDVNVGEPFQFYNHRFVAPADTIDVPRAGVALNFDDTARLPGVAGTMMYTGSRGPVSDARKLRVESFSDSSLTQREDHTKVSANGGRYDFITFDTTPLYLRAYLDVNGNGQFDANEPFQIYNHKGAPPADSVVPGPNKTNINFMFGDENLSSGGAELTGTITYSGAQGPVSDSRPIRLFLFQNDPLQGDSGNNQPVDNTVVTASGGSFTLTAPAPGNYYLAYELDVLPNPQDNDANVGEPFQFYNHRFVAPANTIDLPRAGLALNFDDTARLPGIAGTVTYTGSHGPVSDTSPLIVQSFSDPNLTGHSQDQQLATNSGGYAFIIFDTMPRYLHAFLDVNQNGQLDADEPSEIYPGNPIVPGPDQDALDFEFGDSTTATCIGDCNDDTAVTVDELLTLVNIALGNADVGTCLAGDANHDLQITIDEILTAVGNALNGCPPA